MAFTSQVQFLIQKEGPIITLRGSAEEFGAD
jgi:hypothetical protein